MRLRNIVIFLVLLATTGTAAVGPALFLGYRGETGVESKLFVGAAVDYAPAPYVLFDAGFSLNLFQNTGFGTAELSVGAVAYDPLGLTLKLAVQHQQWSDWRAGENRALVLLEAGPRRGWDAGVGLVHRVPVWGDGYGWPLIWSGGAAEWNLAYRLRWKFVRQESWWLRAGLSSYDRFTAHNPQQFPLALDGAYRLIEDAELTARLATAIVGYSGGLVSFHELELSVGVKREF